MANFVYFNEEWNEEKIRKNNINSPGMVGGIKNANTDSKQEKVYTKVKT